MLQAPPPVSIDDYDKYNKDNKGTGEAPTQYGDKAGEHLRMKRGKYSAKMWVVFGFIGQILFVTPMVVGLLASPIVALAAKHSSDGAKSAALGLGVLLWGVSVWITWRIYRDRWKVTEAFASRFCSGVANLSLFYVPLVAMVYANYRGYLKLRGR